MDNSDKIKKRLEWMQCLDRTQDLYINGVKEFLEFAFSNISRSINFDEDEEIKIPCPCILCNNTRHKSKEEIFEDLVINGIVRGYVRWIYHGEFRPEPKKSKIEVGSSESHNIFTMIQDAHGPFFSSDVLGNQHDTEKDTYHSYDGEQTNHTIEVDIVEKLMRDAEGVLYPGCEELSKLSFILQLFQIKCMEGMTNKAFTQLLNFFKRALPKGTDIPTSYYEARKMITNLGFDYEKIDACDNDCMLFWREDANLENCSICDKKRDKINPKILRFFPITPRLQRLFMSLKTSKDMRWHSESRVKDGVLRHPADSEAWINFDKLYPSFALDARNLKLGLASDGFNPFGGLRSDYSIWPVVVVVYNLPPWMCMKQPYAIMSLLIPGKTAPGNNIDVYLRPLIEELKLLWEVGARTFDASSGNYFQMHAMLMWTINDFPAYGNLSGWSTKGYKACPCCMCETGSLRLPNSFKICYMCHRRFLPIEHKCRDSKTFNGEVEKRDPPPRLSGSAILEHVDELKDMVFGKTNTLPKRDDNWKKKSIFFKLPYWSSLLLRHNLDVMHIEKNVCDNIIGTLLDIEGKTKDSLKVRHDLKCVKMMRHLAPSLLDGKWHIPPAPYTLSKKQKQMVYKFLEELKVPDGYSSNIAKCINIEKRKILGLKSHDFHVLLQQLLPLAIRGVSKTKVYEVITKLSMFFKDLCSKTLRVEDLDRLEDQIIVTLCEMEKIFLPSFFDVSVHLCAHLAAEAKLAGPVQYRWMYPIERLLRKFKCYVRNKSRPEGSIAEGYILEECMLFCSMYLNEIETKYNQLERNAEVENDTYSGLKIFRHFGIPLGKAKPGSLTDEELMKARHYVLQNCEEAEPYISEYEKSNSKKNLVEWFYERVHGILEEGEEHATEVMKDLETLALGPLKGVECFNGYIANGFLFHTRETERKRKNQNSGKCVILFRCDWWDVHNSGRGIKVDKFGIVSVNSRRKLNSNEPFILMSQAEQVFYLKDGFDPNWLLVIKTHPRHHYNVPETNVEEDGEVLQQRHSRTAIDVVYTTLDDDIHDSYHDGGDDILDLVIDANEQNQPRDLPENEEEIEDETFDDEEDISDYDEDCDLDIDIA